jgi:hypothetical protein
MLGFGPFILLADLSCTPRLTIDEKFNGTYKLEAAVKIE